MINDYPQILGEENLYSIPQTTASWPPRYNLRQKSSCVKSKVMHKRKLTRPINSTYPIIIIQNLYLVESPFPFPMISTVSTRFDIANIYDWLSLYLPNNVSTLICLCHKTMLTTSAYLSNTIAEHLPVILILN